MRKSFRWLVGATVLFACVGGATAWPRVRGDQPVAVTAVAVSRGPVQAFVKATGFVDSPTEYTVAAPQSGRITSFAVSTGSTVRRGETTVQVDSRSAEEKLHNAAAQLDAADAQVRQAELDKRAEEAIWKAGGQARQAVEVAIARLESERSHRAAAAADLRAARLQRDTYTVTAPADGVVTEVTSGAGEFVQAGAPLFHLSPRNNLEVRIKIDQSVADLVAVGQVVELSSDAAPGVVSKTRLTRIEPKIQKEGSSYYLLAWAPLAAGDGFKARLNQQLTARILTAAKPDALRVPLDVVTENGGVDVVRLVLNGRLHLQPVHTGIQDGRYVEILDGLREGQQAVFANARQPLKEGQRILVKGGGTS